MGWSPQLDSWNQSNSLTDYPYKSQALLESFFQRPSSRNIIQLSKPSSSNQNNIIPKFAITRKSQILTSKPVINHGKANRKQRTTHAIKSIIKTGYTVTKESIEKHEH